MNQETNKTDAIKGESMSRKLPNGEPNPGFWKWYYAKRKAEGRPIPRASAEYHREYREKRKAEGRPVRSKEAVKAWNQSEKGKAALARYRASDKWKASVARRQHSETPDDYASRIIRDVERISLNAYERGLA